MMFLLCDDYDQALLADTLAIEHLRETQGATGSAWSGVYVDYQGGVPRFAILWDRQIEGVFPEADHQDRIIAGELLVRGENGQFLSGNWEAYVPPAPEEGQGV